MLIPLGEIISVLFLWEERHMLRPSISREVSALMLKEPLMGYFPLKSMVAVFFLLQIKTKPRSSLSASQMSPCSSLPKELELGSKELFKGGCEQDIEIRQWLKKRGGSKLAVLLVKLILLI